MFGLIALFSANGLSLWERIAEWYQNSMLRELLSFINEQYFSVEFGTYENFSVGSTAATTARNLIFALAAGIIIAAIMTARARNGLGGFVRKLLSEDCLSPDRAKTLLELGYFRSTMIRRELARGAALRMVVRCREEEPSDAKASIESAEPVEAVAESTAADPAQVDGSAWEVPPKTDSVYKNARKVDFLTAHFYIPEDLRCRAEVRFDRKGSGWGQVAIVTVLAIVIAAVLCYFLPDVVAFADNIITVFTP